MSRKEHKKAFTLIELMVALLIAGIVFLGAFQFFSTQQKVFRQQAEHAERQSGVRTAAYYIAKDLMNAGYTGTPYGVESALHNAYLVGFSTPIRAVRWINPQTDSEFSAYALTSPTNNQPVDALEIWANFTGLNTRLSNLLSSGTNMVYVENASIFQLNIFDEVMGSMVNVEPLGIVVSSPNYIGEYHPISSVDVSGNVITISEMFVNSYTTSDVAGPVWRRVYFIMQDSDGVRWLVRRDYYKGRTVDTKLARGIVDFQVFFDVMDPTLGTLTMNVDPAVTPVDPCQIQAVRFELTGEAKAPGQMQTTYITVSRRVKIHNLWIHPLFNHTCP